MKRYIYWALLLLSFIFLFWIGFSALENHQGYQQVLQQVNASIDQQDIASLRANLIAYEENITLHYYLLFSLIFLWFIYAWYAGLPRASRRGSEHEESASGLAAKESMEDKYKRLARYDPLTGLDNRYLFQVNLKRALIMAGREKKKVALFFIDLDNFKRVNDTMGHEAGDLLLQLSSKRLISAARGVDLVARIGGDEFTIIAQNINGPSGAADIAKRVIDVFHLPFLIKGEEIHVSPSIGVSIYPDVSNSVKEIVKYADIAMYQAKNEGKGCYRFFTASLDESMQRRVLLESKLRHAVENQEFYLVFQPQINSRIQRCVGMEVLLRWHNPDMGDVFPDEFIPIAEESGLIVDIGEWVIKETCHQLKIWKKEFSIISQLKISINISIVQLEKTNVSDIILRYFSEVELPIDNIAIEVTETTLMKNIEVAKKALRDISDAGILIFLDDFGTGFSSLSLLQEMPIGGLKIDYSFIHQLVGNEDNIQLVRGIVQLSKSLGIFVIAEGVETQEQVLCLRKNGCDFVQGYFYSKPMPPTEVEKFLLKEQVARGLDK